MKPIVLYDPGEPFRNEYLSKQYFQSLQEWSADHATPLHRIENPDDVKDSIILINGDHLPPCRIRHLKESGNRLIAFDINDNTALSEAYRDSPDVLLIDLIFKVGGIQKVNQSQDLCIDENFNFSLARRDFAPEPLWMTYKALSDASRLQSLPYVPWVCSDAPQRSYTQRSGNVLVRGGNHFYRFMTFLNLLKSGRADDECSFVTADYFRRDMTPQFRNCEDCIREREILGRTAFLGDQTGALTQCTSPATWGGDYVQGLDKYESANHWNNRCPRSFFWLTEQFEKKHGPVPHDVVERALNGSYTSTAHLLESVANATYYTDLKWLFSIYAPPRFWEAACAGTINLLPRRTNEQSFFPHIEDKVHYLTFLEDFSELWPQTSETVFQEITENSKELFDGWIRAGRYPISERLCRHIFSQIEIAVAS